MRVEYLTKGLGEQRVSHVDVPSTQASKLNAQRQEHVSGEFWELQEASVAGAEQRRGWQVGRGEEAREQGPGHGGWPGVPGRTWAFALSEVRVGGGWCDSSSFPWLLCEEWTGGGSWEAPWQN